MTNRKSFIIHKDSLDILDKLSDEQAGKLFKAIYFYQKTQKMPQLDFALDLVFTSFFNQFKRDDENYKITCEARKIAGSKGGKQKVANASNCLQKVANLADSKNESESDSDSDSKNKNDQEYIINSNNILIDNNIIAKKEKVKNFVKPTIDELIDYCNQNVLNVDPENFIDYYNSNGWKVGKNPMKDWKATARTWHRNNKNKNNQVNYQKTNGMTAKEKANWQAFADFGNNKQTF
jgi:hypothetical protein